MVNNPTVKIQEESQFYQMSDFGADIGGYLGLLMGASVFTLYSVCEALVVKMMKHFRRKSSSNSKIHGRIAGKSEKKLDHA